jgi:hypothetical protein
MEEFFEKKVSKVEFFKIKSPETILRVLPATEKPSIFQRKVHWMASSEGKLPVTCLDKGCPICQKYWEIYNKWKEESKDKDYKHPLYIQSKPFAATQSALMNAYIRGVGHVVLEVSGFSSPNSLGFMIRELLQKFQKETNIEAISLHKGVWLKINKSGTSAFDTRYTVQLNETLKHENGRKVLEEDKTILPEEFIDDYNNLVVNLQKLNNPSTSEQLQRILNGEFVDVVLEYKKKSPVIRNNEEVKQNLSTSDSTLLELIDVPF